MRIIGHRGAKGEVPENTLASFQFASSKGIYDFELDIQLSKDNQLVVIHDTSINRTTGITGKVSDFTLAELTQMDASKDVPPWPTPCYIPSLDDVISTCHNANSFQLEVKTDAKVRLKQVCELLTALVKEKALNDKATITSSDTLVLQLVKQLNPDISTGYIAQRRIPDPVKTAEGLKCKLLVLHHNLASPALISTCKKKQIEVSCWTVNRLPEIDRLRQLGVESVITDYPTLVQDYYKNMV